MWVRVAICWFPPFDSDVGQVVSQKDPGGDVGFVVDCADDEFGGFLAREIGQERIGEVAEELSC